MKPSRREFYDRLRKDRQYQELKKLRQIHRHDPEKIREINRYITKRSEQIFAAMSQEELNRVRKQHGLGPTKLKGTLEVYTPEQNRIRDEIRCECGSEKTSGPTATHSSWCPKNSG